jgi:hypothetical protein
MRYLFLLAAVAAFPAADEKTDYQQLADAAAWKWSPEQANRLSSLDRYHGDYQVEIIRKPNTIGKLTIRVSDDGKPVYSWEGHSATVFVVEGKVLYYTEFHPSSSGCELVAYDLAKKEQLWKTALKGLGPIAHFRYRNDVALELAGDALLVHGKESAGNYIEYLDRKSGKSVGHKTFPNK